MYSLKYTVPWNIYETEFFYIKDIYVLYEKFDKC